MTKNEKRTAKLIPNGVPRWVRCYDAGPDTGDRYTAVYSKRSNDRWFDYRGMSEFPCSPQGVGQFGQSQHAPIDAPRGAWPPAVGRKNHLGRRILFSELPPDCQRLVVDDYKEIWKIN